MDMHTNFCVLTLNRPKVNAINQELVQDLNSRITQIQQNNSMRGIILTGLPGTFSAGLDVPHLSSLKPPELEVFWKHFISLLITILESRLIFISAISGHAPAGGLVLSLATDYRIMCEGNFKLGLNEVAVGIRVPKSVTELTASVVGSRNAQLALLTGKLYSPSEAQNLGFVDEIVSRDSLLPYSIKFMNEWLNSTSFAVDETRKRTNHDLVSSMKSRKEEEVKAFVADWFDEKNLRGCLKNSRKILRRRKSRSQVDPTTFIYIH